MNALIDPSSPAERWARLGDAYQVNAQIAVFTQDDATIIPSGALFRRGDNWNVYVVNDGRAELRDIQILRRSGRLAAVAWGLTPGELVIVYPSDHVVSGVHVRLRQPSNSSPGR